jgi:hypothetical protein
MRTEPQWMRAQSRTAANAGQLLANPARLGLRREAKRHAAFARANDLLLKKRPPAFKRRRRSALPAQSMTRV